MHMYVSTNNYCHRVFGTKHGKSMCPFVSLQELVSGRPLVPRLDLSFKEGAVPSTTSTSLGKESNHPDATDSKSKFGVQGLKNMLSDFSRALTPPRFRSTNRQKANRPPRSIEPTESSFQRVMETVDGALCDEATSRKPVKTIHSRFSAHAHVMEHQSPTKKPPWRG